MSSNYCIQLEQNFLAISIATVNPVNFSSLQFSLNVNSLVIFLFSKYPFSFGYQNHFCINQDYFGFAQAGENFNVDLSNYQGYYMLILIKPQGIDFTDIGKCQIVPNLTMTFQNTTISPVESETINSNYDSKYETGFCSGVNIESVSLGILCNNPNYVSIIQLNNLGNQLVIITCQGFVYENNITVKFVAPTTCFSFGAYIPACLEFIGNQQVIDFLNSNNILYSIISQSECKTVPPIQHKITSTQTCKPIPCLSVYQFGKLLTPPTKHSLISSKLWNEIVQDLYLTYSVFRYINYLSQISYPQNIYPVIMEFYNFNKNFQPYEFVSLLHAEKGKPLTAEEFNKLIDTIIELANENTIQLQANLNKVQHNEVVRASQFANIVYDVNQFLTFNHNQYFLLDCLGTKFVNLLSSISTFLNVLISQPSTDITIPSNAYIKNLLMYCNSHNIVINGSVGKLVLNSNLGTIQLQNFASINSFILNSNSGVIEIEDYTNIETLQINQNSGTVIVRGNANITTLQIQNNSGVIEIEDYAVVENLVCEKNSGTVNIASTAVVINNNCPSS